MPPTAALEASVPSVPPVTPLAGAGKPRARLRRRGIDRRAPGDVRSRCGCGTRPVSAAFSRAACPRAAPVSCRPKGKSALPIQHNSRYAKCARPQAAKARALRITELCLAPRPAVLCGKPRCLFDAGEAAPPPHPRCSAVALRATAFNVSPARPAVCCARLQPLRVFRPVLAARTRPPPRGSPNRAGDGGGCAPLSWSA